QVPALRLSPAPPLDLDLRSLREQVQSLTETIEELEEFERAVVGSSEKVRSLAVEAARSESGCEALEVFVGDVRERERALADKWAPIRRGHERQVARARLLGSKEPLWTSYADLQSRATEAVIRLLEALQGIRLEIAAILTAVDEGEGPVFDNAADLKNYLRSL
ncbi:MAG TPA: hypothetical protein VLF66_05435, partial [Thermoanaerobaculia bacterium]|nr:hypothetical protein [Thermoanaerobaculia bacterium]